MKASKLSRIHKKTLLYNKRGGIVIYTPNSDCRSKEFNLGRDTKTNTLTLYVKHSFDEAPGFVYICPTWEGYQAKLEHLVRKLADYHHDFISMDIGPLGQPRSCHNSSHDHLRGLGFGTSNITVQVSPPRSMGILCHFARV